MPSPINLCTHLYIWCQLTACATTVSSELRAVMLYVCRLVTDKDTGKPKGFAFCEYHDQFAAESAVRNLNGHDMSGRQIRVGRQTLDSAGQRRVCLRCGVVCCQLHGHHQAAAP